MVVQRTLKEALAVTKPQALVATTSYVPESSKWAFEIINVCVLVPDKTLPPVDGPSVRSTLLRRQRNVAPDRLTASTEKVTVSPTDTLCDSGLELTSGSPRKHGVFAGGSI